VSAKNPNPDPFVPHNWGEKGSDIHLHAMAAGSRANGPGLRAVIWLQGCTLGCPGCFNTPTHPQSGGEWLAVDTLFKRIQSLAPGLEGLTVSGGEPLQQIGPLSALLRRVRQETSLTVIVFTGFSAAELERLPGIAALKASVDVLIAGRYEQDQRLARGLLGSANKRLLFLTGRYQAADFADLPEAEILIGPDGQVTYSGIDPLT